MRQLKVLVVTALASIVVACSSAPPAPTAKDSKGQTEANPKTPATATPSADGKTPTTTSPTEPGPDGKTEDDGACYEACIVKHAAGAKAYDELEATATACQCQSSVCGAQCAQTACKAESDEEKTDAACDACLEGAPAAQCWTTFESACSANADCAAVQTCYDACGGGDD
jgi:hypothetical protein